MDNSFLRLEKDFATAINTDESPAVEIHYRGAIQLLPNETYLQISNSKTDIIFNDNYEVFYVDECGNELIEVTNKIFINEFVDNNGIKQITWEFINPPEMYLVPVSLRFINNDNGDTWYTNLFLSTDYESKFTSRLDYKSKGYHYGTQYNVADFYQSIRLRFWFTNKVNESERKEYHQKSTDITVSARNTKKRKERFTLENFDIFTIDRLEDIITNTYVYLNFVRHYSSIPIEFPERSGNTNMFEDEMLLNKSEDDVFEFSYQIYTGLQVVKFIPSGTFTTGAVIPQINVTFNQNITLGTGEINLYQSNGALLNTFNETELQVSGNQISIITPIIMPNTDSYYLTIGQGLVEAVEPFEGITNTTTWTYNIQGADFDATFFNNNDFLT